MVWVSYLERNLIMFLLLQVYQVEVVIIKAGNSPRPAAWILEKSLDGENFHAWQYYAPNNEDCWMRYSVAPMPGKPKYSADDEVICTAYFSKKMPEESGQVMEFIMLKNYSFFS